MGAGEIGIGIGIGFGVAIANPALSAPRPSAQDVALLHKNAKAQGILLRRAVKAKNGGFAAEEESTV
jgi:hypothetical protein